MKSCFSILCFVIAAVCMSSHAWANRVLHLRETKHLTSSDESTLVQPGEIILLDEATLGESDAYSIAFWIKAYTDDYLADQEIHEYYDIGGIWTDYDYGRRLLHIDDGSWHFVEVYYSYDAASSKISVETLMDGQVLGTINSESFNEPHDIFVIGADGISIDQLGGTEIGKHMTDKGLLVDDLMIWKDVNDTIKDEISIIRLYGPSKIDQGSSAFQGHFDFENLTETPPVYADKNVRNGRKVTYGFSEYSIEKNANPELLPGYQPPYIINVSVMSDYGSSAVSPAVGQAMNFDFHASDTLTFSAPQYVYLDQFGNELGFSDDVDLIGIIEQAYYRAVCVGYKYKAGGSDEQSGTTDTLSIELPLTADISFTWEWEIEYAVIVEYAGVDDSLDDMGDPEITEDNGTTHNTIGKKWIKPGTELSASVLQANATGTYGVRYSMTDWRVENAVTSTNDYRFIQLSGKIKDEFGGKGGLEPVAGDSGVDISGDGFTFDFWMRHEESTSNTEERIFLKDYTHTGQNGDYLIMTCKPSENRLRFIGFGLNSSSIHDWHTDKVTDGDWHHYVVSVSFDLTNNNSSAIGLYIDGELFATEDYLVDQHTPLQTCLWIGSHDGYHHLNACMDNFRVWGRALDMSDVVDSMKTQDYAGQAQGLELEMTFDDVSYDEVGDVVSVDAWVSDNNLSTASNSVEFKYISASVLIPGVESQGLVDELFPYTFTKRPLQSGSRASTGNYIINDWLRIIFSWDLQFQITLNTTHGLSEDGLSGSHFTGLAFVSSEGDVNDVIQDSSSSYWVKGGCDVIVGSRYRTDDRRYSLNGVTGKLGLFIDCPEFYSLEDSIDESGNVTREFLVSNVDNTGSLTFLYDKTRFRAIVPLGDVLDVSDSTAANLQLVPNLPDGAVLEKYGSGPSLLEEQRLFESDEGTGSSLKIQWDEVGEQLLPLQPGIYRLEWQDEIQDESFLVEIISGFPGDTEQAYWFLENEDGSQMDVNGAATKSVTFEDVSDAFPGSPTAHYNYLYNVQEEKTPPVQLDANDADRWFFVEQTYTEASSVTDSDSGEFMATESGRSVLLFNYTPDPSNVAIGDSSSEAFAVRIVESSEAVGSMVSSAEIQDDQRQALYVNDEMDAGFILMSGGSNPKLAFVENQDLTIAFWCKLDDEVSDDTANRIAFVSRLNYYDGYTLTEFGFRGSGVDEDARVPYIGERYFGHSGFSTENRFHDVVVDDGWHYWAVTFDSSENHLKLYMDGIMVGEEVFYSNSPEASALALGRGIHGHYLTTLNGYIDSFVAVDELWTADQIRSASMIEDSLASNLDFYFSFDHGVSQGSGNYIDIDNEGTINASGSDAIFCGFINENWGEGGENKYSLMPTDSRPLFGYPQADAHAEVATRILSRLDTAGLGSGYIHNRISNYNASLYDRESDVGAWGPIYPVNWDGVFEEGLAIYYYENPYEALKFSEEYLHPNVAWPHALVTYDTVEFPSKGEHADKRIYVASRLGTEGVDANGDDQLVFDPAQFGGLTIYNQPYPEYAGYNPNEEHALIAPSIKDQLTGDIGFILGQDAAFALQNKINRYGLNDSDLDTNDNNPEEFTSEPWVLVDYQDLDTEEWRMAAYKVEETRSGAEPFPALDPTTHGPVDSLGESLAQPSDPTYDFYYPYFAGDILIPPYPLNRVIGAAILEEQSGGNLPNSYNFIQRTIWNDINDNTWCVSGNGNFFYRYWYPMRDDFWFETGSQENFDGINDVNTGTPLAWLPESREFFDPKTTTSVIVDYHTYWRDDYPVLKRGETVTYPGGEYFNENSGAEGLPGVVAWAAGEVVYDSVHPAMNYSQEFLDHFSARLIRPLDRYVVDLPQSNLPDALTPAYTENILVVGSRWYFKGLAGSLQKRFYYDSLTGELVFRGRLNDLESGDPDLIAMPISLHILEPNVLTESEYEFLTVDWLIDDIGLGGSEAIFSAIDEIYMMSQNPSYIEFSDAETYNPADVHSDNRTGHVFLSGMQPADFDVLNANELPYLETQPLHYDASYGLVGYANVDVSSDAAKLALYGDYHPLRSLGTGAALVPNPKLLTSSSDEPAYITLLENNHVDAGGAVAIHIIQIGEERYRGGIKMVEAQDVFDEKINLRHSGDFGANTEDVYYQWWMREVDALDNVGLPQEDPSSGDYDPEWQLYTQGLGLHQIEFRGRPDIALSDKLFYVRYGERDELDAVNDANDIGLGNDTTNGLVADASWRLVDINDQDDRFTVDDSPRNRVPFQWAGASNSPQYQSDGSYSYIPQLIMGWVKRVLDRVNPYEARYTDFYGNESPATYSSQLQIAGGPYVGDVALNSDKDVIEDVGLIALYETILHRAKSLTLDIDGASTDGTNQALLFAATRLAFLYELHAREAYSDYQDPTISMTVTAYDGGGEIDSVNAYLHAFHGLVSSLLQEEMALLRGADYVKAYPSYNRLFWNYTKGEGEAAYNAEYNIQDVNEDGFINEYDAAELYPMGHGDAWGHFLSALGMHYELLQHPAFDWQSRSELYSLLDNVIEVDFLDEKSFARIAAAKASAAVEIIRATYRQAYTEDPDGQWQGYTDADETRAWGVSEWGKRTGQATLFDWVVANALVPADADEANDAELEDLDQIDRRANEAEISEIAMSGYELQIALDHACDGLNPLGFDPDAMIFDIDAFAFNDDGRSHFEQVYDKAEDAAHNALKALEYSIAAGNDLRSIADDTRTLQIEALRQDIDYRNRLIEIFGRPYEGTIGPGQIYEEGYIGPDTKLYLYIDTVDFNTLIPDTAQEYIEITDEASEFKTNFKNDYLLSSVSLNDIESPGNFEAEDFYSDLGLMSISSDPTLSTEAYFVSTEDYAFQVPDSNGDGVSDWGKRSAYGEIQILLGEMLQEEIILHESIREYEQYLEEAAILTDTVENLLRNYKRQSHRWGEYFAGQALFEALDNVLYAQEQFFETNFEFIKYYQKIKDTGYPTVNGVSNDLTFAARMTSKVSDWIISQSFYQWWEATRLARHLNQTSQDIDALRFEWDSWKSSEFADLASAGSDLGRLLTEEEAKRLDIAEKAQALQIKSQELKTKLAEGFRLLDQREAFNMILASKAQRHRYSDMLYRIARNEALGKYRNAFENALRYAWLAAKAYEYETSLSPDSPDAVTSLLESLIKERSLGHWYREEPRIGLGGIAEALATLKLNYERLEGQLGINNPQLETGYISLRKEYFRIKEGNYYSDERWKKALQARRVDDLWALPEFGRFCRPPLSRDEGPLPGIVIEFGTEIFANKNFFGHKLGGEDHAYDPSVYATKISSVGVWFEGYNDAEVATTPRCYLIPVGTDVLRLADAEEPTTRTWNILEQTIPNVLPINDSHLEDVGYIPSVDSVNGSFVDIKRFSAFRAYHSSGEEVVSIEEMMPNTRLIGRSVWNTRWMLIIPGNYLHGDNEYGLDQFVENVSDIKLAFETFSNAGL
ncbi:LamG domain-containing protein [Cerasicoccus frondis]|uniref:LamG domain-containing protein n=1 Tax=Cerasicoccus frondis TaxID=490090 RepID=UPI00285271A1|nr:LamG domain-containing protein [Cerasicoccus frondis]